MNCALLPNGVNGRGFTFFGINKEYPLIEYKDERLYNCSCKICRGILVCITREMATDIVFVLYCKEEVIYESNHVRKRSDRSRSL